MGQAVTYGYDAAGNLVQKIDAKDQKTAYDYDQAGRLVRIRYFAKSADTAPAKTVDFTYDKAGNLKTRSDGAASGAFTYDALHRKLTDKVSFGPFDKEIAYAWTGNSQKASFTDASGIVYDYAYANRRLAGITIPGTGTVTTGAYNWNRPGSVTLPGGSGKSFTYDPLMRMRSARSEDPGKNPVMSYTYTHDGLDNIKTKSTEHGEYAYGYDSLQRLTSADNPEALGAADETFTYDSVGNRATRAGDTDPWEYNANNELETAGNTGYEYDANGNMTKKTVGTSVTLFFYNLEDRLVRVEDGSANVIAQYGYDPFGRRIWKEVSGTRTYFMYADEGLIGEYDAAGAEITAYGWKPGGDLGYGSRVHEKGP